MIINLLIPTSCRVLFSDRVSNLVSWSSLFSPLSPPDSNLARRKMDSPGPYVSYLGRCIT